MGYWLGIVFGMVIRALCPIPIAFCWVDWDNIVPVDNIEQLTTELLDESLVNSNSFQAQCTSESQRNYLIKIKAILSSLKFKLLFFLIFFVTIIATISCKDSDLTVVIHVGKSYLKTAINICCVRFVPSLNAPNISSNLTMI